MARHIMAVCVVCLICAEHLPCKEHLISENHQKSVRSHFGSNVIEANDRSAIHAWLTSSAEHVTDPDFRIKNTYEKQKHKSKPNRHKVGDLSGRVRRQLVPHDDHDHEHDHDHSHGDHEHHEPEVRPEKPNSYTFLKEIFKQFGDADGMQMNVTGFEKMLTDLGLFKLVTEKLGQGMTHSITPVSEDGPNNSCINSLHLMSAMPSGDQLKRPKITKLLEQYKDGASESSPPVAVVNATNLKKDVITLKVIKENVMIDTKDLWTMCPILLYQLVAPTSRERNGCIQNNLLPLKFDQSTFLDHLISASEEEAEYGTMEDRTLGEFFLKVVFGKFLRPCSSSQCGCMPHCRYWA